MEPAAGFVPALAAGGAYALGRSHTPDDDAAKQETQLASIKDYDEAVRKLKRRKMLRQYGAGSAALPAPVAEASLKRDTQEEDESV